MSLRSRFDSVTVLLVATILSIVTIVAMCWITVWAVDQFRGEREARAQSICDAFDGFTDALAASSQPETAKEAAELVRRTTMFKADLFENRLAALECEQAEP